MSGSQADLTGIVLALQDIVKALFLSQQTMAGGLTVNTGLTACTVAGLPVPAPLGRLAYASNGRNTGQGAGAGTGCLVVGNGSVFTAVWSGLAVTA